jgi:circadian clock protein KaiC
MHLVRMHRAISEYQPRVVVIDPISNLMTVGSLNEVRATLTRLIDFLKTANITVLFTSLTGQDGSPEQTEVGISSLIDTWVLLRTLDSGSVRSRGLLVVKSRGMAHSNQLREFQLTDHGLQFVQVYPGAAQEKPARLRRADAAAARPGARRTGK